MRENDIMYFIIITINHVNETYSYFICVLCYYFSILNLNNISLGYIRLSNLIPSYFVIGIQKKYVV